jgi:hypothetical protein
MHPDDLNMLWLCCECGRRFAFNSDVEEHKRQFNHLKMMLCDLQARAKKAPPLFTRGRMSLDFRLNEEVSRVIVEYEYYPSNDTINYVDVRYTDSKLKSMVEGNPDIMKNIDNYLHRLLPRNLPVRP